jgi:hypothetical protein
VIATGRGLAGVLLLGGLTMVTGCGASASAGAPSVTVRVGDQQIQLHPTQYCLDGEGQRYETSPPIIEALPDTTISFTVADPVASAGWSVQVFDEKLEQIIGEVQVDPDTAMFSEITTSDVVPPTFYLVVVEKSDPKACSGLSGAWPVGFIRATAPSASPTATSPGPPAG